MFLNPLVGADELLLPELIVAEIVYVLESFHEVPTDDVAQLVRSVVASRLFRTLDPALLLRSLEVYEVHGIGLAEVSSNCVPTRLSACFVVSGPTGTA